MSDLPNTLDDDDEISIEEFERLLDAELQRLFPDLLDSPNLREATRSRDRWLAGFTPCSSRRPAVPLSIH